MNDFLTLVTKADYFQVHSSNFTIFYLFILCNGTQ